ncbi:MAG TPA: NAD(P)-dependent oxidoreductase [Solirubrobacteraceae bacterium]|nr:NAD(P)-dependent oxidoreductase [Solirubrobacteraceae bacterium]
MRVALLGTGAMGAPMARRLVSAGHDLRVWNRSRERAAAIERATVCDTPADAASGAEVVITMLADAPAVESAMEGVELGDAVWAQMSTIGVEPPKGVRPLYFVDAPVLGSTPAAEQGQLTILASGPHERCAAVFEPLGRTIDLGPEPGAGQRMKLVLNHWVVALVEGLAETVLLAERLDVDPRQFLEIIDGGAIGPPYAKLKGTNMIERSYEPNFSLKLARKDAELIAAAVDDLPLVRLISERMGAAIAAGHADDDFSAVVEAGRR